MTVAQVSLSRILRTGVPFVESARASFISKMYISTTRVFSAAVPCYRLGQLHQLIKHEMPYCPNGLRETWKHIADIQKRQEREPDYQFVAELPPSQA
jgi:hypothetical protein